MTISGDETGAGVRSGVATKYPFSRIRQRLRAHTGAVLDFALGEWNLSPPEAIRAHVHAAADDVLRRATASEVAALADAAAAMMQREYGVAIDPACLLPMPSARAAMSAFLACRVSPGDRVLVTEPGYPAFATLAARRGGALCAALLDPQRSFEPACDAIEPRHLRATVLVGLNYPNNPTGVNLSDAAFAALRRQLDPRALVFNDATYGPLVYDGPPRSMLADADGTRRDGVVELHSFQKLFALGPLGIALLLGPADLITEIRDYSEFATSPMSGLHVCVAERCARDAGHVQATRALFARRVADLHDVLRRLGFDPYPTPAGMYVLCRVPRAIDGVAVKDAEHAAELLLSRYDLGVVGWDVPPHGYLRFSIMYRPKALDALAAQAVRLEPAGAS
jgi:aspartate/methionine/tyrosine aminotransferase